ncbi:hypothetical protein [Primorskyibacter sp. S187A]|uniref:hypothetical protein n=1 Tax=Primorskyibacter sp. S187A TaxID=3415130 RepID=UPI003C7D4648
MHPSTTPHSRTRAPRHTPRVRQADRFECLVAASEVDEICPIWIIDRFEEQSTLEDVRRAEP